MSNTMSFAVAHFTEVSSVGYLLSGSLLIGGAIALLEPAVNTVVYHFYEKAWNRMNNATQVRDENCLQTLINPV